MSDTSSAACPACEGAGCTLVHVSHPDDPKLRRDIWECPHCGFLFPHPAVEQAWADLPESFFYDDWRLLDLAGIPHLYDHIMATLRRRAPGSIRSHRTPSILEAGCGAGQVLNHFRAHGWAARGVEPWRSVAAAGAKYLRLPIDPVKLEAAELEPASQDIVLSLDVLNFVAAPRAYAEACYRALKPGGMLYLVVPNAASAERTAAGWDWNFFVPTSHMGAYTADAVARLIGACGFTRLEITPHDGTADDLFLRVTAVRPHESLLRWEDIGDVVDDAAVPFLDRSTVDASRLTALQRQWREDGMVILPKLLPSDLIDRYCAVRSKVREPGGWVSETPYRQVPEIKDLCLHPPLAELLEHLIGHPMGLHLNLTGWVSTERDWHQDDYLNPPFVSGHYAAVWMALDRIHPDAGPFQFVRGSHRWPLIRQQKILQLLDHDGSDTNWPTWSERLLTPFFEQEIARRGAEVEEFLGERGDVLIWHSRLLHRGSLATRPGAERRSLISHYSAIDHRPDMGHASRHPTGGYFFDFSDASPLPPMMGG
ncbi:phytanoyl-CoA dioxygenase family protein [Aliidongia sp.]|uniref:phytanoyl-CoA dioxygenase family protein n=1 Tax=Aliidongia sp. TaxID=1914230 RepID=UPI002DDD74D8|nr:phytanoyl-CoA dioxygenase family protein [Aliidongia sp.]